MTRVHDRITSSRILYFRQMCHKSLRNSAHSMYLSQVIHAPHGKRHFDRGHRVHGCYCHSHGEENRRPNSCIPKKEQLSQNITGVSTSRDITTRYHVIVVWVSQAVMRYSTACHTDRMIGKYQLQRQTSIFPVYSMLTHALHVPPITYN